MAVNYNDERFNQVNNEKQTAINENEKIYNDMISQSDSYYQAQIDASKDWANKQQQLQQEQTDFAIEKIEQQKEQTKQDYIKEQAGAYHDWQKQIDPYGVKSEQIASMGLTNSGYAESSKVAMYVAYQNRVATARESYNRAVLNYDNAIKDARMQNNSVLAEIAYNSLQQQLELSLQGFQYKNTLVLQKAETKRNIDNTYYARYQDVLNQIKWEEEQNFQREQFNWQKSQASKSSGSGGGGSSGGSSQSKKSTTAKDTNTKKKMEQTLAGSGIKTPSKSSEPTVDMKSVTALGYGPISASKLNSLVASGEVIEYEQNGVLKYKRATTKSNALSSSAYLPKSVKKKLGLK